MDLNEELTSREHVELRESVVAGVGRLRAARARRSRIVAGVTAAVAVAVVVVAVVVTASKPPARTTTPVETVVPSPSVSTSLPSPSTPAPSPTTSAPPTPSPSLSPTIAFGDDCAVAADLDALSAAAQATAAPLDRAVSPAVRTLGGRDCAWLLPDAGRVEMSALPLSVVPNSFRQRYAEVVCEGYRYDGSGCRRAFQTDAMWVLVTASSILGSDNRSDDKATSARLEAVIPVFQAAAAQAIAPRAAQRTPDWWRPVACEELGSRIPLAEILHTSEYQEGYPSGFGTDVSNEIAKAAGLGEVCRWYANPAGGEMTALIVNVYPGAAWDGDKIIADAAARGGDPTSVDVTGATAAVMGRGAVRPTSHYLWATAGVNVLSVLEAPDVVSAAARVIAALNAAR